MAPIETMLRPGATISCHKLSEPLEVIRLLGRGGQGEVYEVAFAGERLAAKWYHPRFAARDPELLERLRDSIRATAPGPAFLWPMTLLQLAAASAAELGLPGGSFGYLMALRPTEYVGAIEHEAARLTISLRDVVRACFFLVEAFDRLHSRGLCYKDISTGNLFLRPRDGRILICDNDNVAVTGAGRGAALGTPGFMAPEVLLGQARPSSGSDLFSLAVLLFRLLTRSDPFKGRLELGIRCLDLPAQRQLYGVDPVFVFDARDDRNRPDPEVHRAACLTWPIYPPELQRHFQQTFGPGLRDPSHRVLTGQWCETLAAVLDQRLLCPHCGQEVFGSGDGSDRCWACGGVIGAVPRLALPRGGVLAQPGNELHPHHFDALALENLDAPVARVEAHPGDPRILGLLNCGERTWSADLAGGGSVTVEPGRRCSLARVVRIHTHHGVIRALG
jgi:DNA-binding helix-hairpin-helix protein with protein kinase domain